MEPVVSFATAGSITLHKPYIHLKIVMTFCYYCVKKRRENKRSCTVIYAYQGVLMIVNVYYSCKGGHFVQKQAIRTFIIILFACILLLCSSASVMPQRLTTLQTTRCLSGWMYTNCPIPTTIYLKRLDSITTGGNKVFIKLTVSGLTC